MWSQTLLDFVAEGVPAAVLEVDDPNPGGSLVLGNCAESGPSRLNIGPAVSTEAARLRLRRAALESAMANVRVVDKHTLELAHSSRAKELFNQQRQQTATRFALQRGSSGNCLGIETADRPAVSDHFHMPARTV